jgi:antitoxin ParD1/3/4
MDDAIKSGKTATTDVTKILSPEQMEWLKAQVASGQYPSIEEGIRSAVMHAQIEIENAASEDLDWVKPYIEEALAEIERGEGIPAEQVFAELREQAKTFKD